MLERTQTALLVIDVQGKLAEIMYEREALFDGCRRLLEGARALELPVLVCEQNPERMGPTRPELAAVLGSFQAIPKMSFSCWGEPACRAALAATGRRQVLLCGIETHVCVYQSALDLRTAGFEVGLVADAVSSRTGRNRDLGIQRLVQEGIALYTVEMALMELLRAATDPRFKDVLRIIR